MVAMRFLPTFGRPAGQAPDSGIHTTPSRPVEEAEEVVVQEDTGVLKTIGWVSAALGAVAIGLLVGREIRQRYKFNRRTPYDLYAHSGDEVSDMSDIEFGVGI